MKSGSRLERTLEAGHFAFTGELGPPQGANGDHVRKKASHLRGIVDAVNITDNQTAVVRMSSWGALIALQEGLEPNYQMVCRDRNRIAIQSDILGAYAHGIRNMLCLSGDHQQFGNHPLTKGVFDIDSIQLISLVKKMRDEKKFLNGDDIDGPPQMFIGAAENPFAEPYQWRVHRLAKKVAAGADFIQTQCFYDYVAIVEKIAADINLHQNMANGSSLLPKISVITPSYNQVKFIPYTIESVLSQQYPNLEYIIVDGGSTDGSLEIIQQYASQLAWWVSEPDQGQTDAINKGFAHSNGEILAWLNSDDTYLPGAGSQAVSCLVESPQAAMVYGNANMIDDQGNIIGRFPSRQTDLHRLLRGSVHILQQTTFLWTRYWELVGPLVTSAASPRRARPARTGCNRPASTRSRQAKPSARPAPTAETACPGAAGGSAGTSAA